MPQPARLPFQLRNPRPTPTGKEGAGRKGLRSSLPQPTNSRPRPPRNPSHPRQHTPPTSARTNKHIHLRARKSVQTHFSRPQNHRFFFPFPRNHLRPTHTPSQPPLCARNTPSARKYGGPTPCTCASLTTTATSSNSSKRQRATCKQSPTRATCATTKSSGGPANPTSPKPWPKPSLNRQSQHPSQPRPCPRPSRSRRPSPRRRPLRLPRSSSPRTHCMRNTPRNNSRSNPSRSPRHNQFKPSHPAPRQHQSAVPSRSSRCSRFCFTSPPAPAPPPGPSCSMRSIASSASSRTVGSTSI